MNHNVTVAFVYTGLSAFAIGIWGSAVLSGYLKVLTGTNTRVGIAEGIQGACQVAFAFPAGYLSDKSRRDKVMRSASILGFISVFFILFALFYVNDRKTDEWNLEIEFILMTIGLALWGSFVGCTNAPLEALFADSTTNENRPKMNQYKFSLLLTAACSGPLTAIMLFYIVGDVWNLYELRIVFAIGVILLIPAIGLVWLFDDERSLNYVIGNEENEEIILPESLSSIDSPKFDNNDQLEKSLSNINNDEDLDEPLLDPRRIRLQREPSSASLQQEPEFSLTENTSSGSIAISRIPSNSFLDAEFQAKQRYWIPRIIVGTDLLAGFASGMTIKFFPLFFKEESMMSPIEVSFTLISAYLSVSLLSYIFRSIFVQKFGRVIPMLLFGIPGSLLLSSMYLMSIGYDIKLPGQVPLWRNKLVMIPLYVVRTGLMNALGPTKRAILMEFVPKNERGFWSAFESLTRFGWSGSAVVGGILMDAYGYGVTFLATSLIQLSYSIATGVLLFYIE